MSVLGLSLLVPGGPAQFGVFHYGLLLGLSMFFPESEVRARGSVFIFWMFVMQLGVGIVLGTWAQRQLKLDWRRVFGLGEREPGEVPGAGPPRPSEVSGEAVAQPGEATARPGEAAAQPGAASDSHERR